MMDKEQLRRSIFKLFKKNKLVFNCHEWVTGYKDIRIQNAIHSNDLKKSRQQIRREKELVRNYWHCGTFHYWRYGLPYLQLTDEEILDYVPTYYHHKRLEKDHAGIDTVYWGGKQSRALLLRERGITTGDVLAWYNGEKWMDFTTNQEIDIVDAITKTLREEGGKLFLKPTGGEGGSGIFVIKESEGSIVVNGIKRDISEFVQNLPGGTFILQKGIVQSKQMMEINPSSVNTLRVVVQQEGECMKMRTCIIRMGRKGKEVDNSAQGGVSVKVDTSTGQVAATATAEHGGGVMTCHPDTGKSFGDIAIENWPDLKTQIESIGTKLIDFKNIALDIAVTEEGAKLLEFNFRYGIEHQQCVLGGVRRLLGIYPELV